MDDNNQQNYPLRPNLVPQKQPSKLKVGLSALTPKKKLWLVLGLLATVIVTALIIYFALASGKRYYFSPNSDTWQQGSTYTINVYVHDEDNDFINGIEMQIDYTDIFNDNEEAVNITASYPAGIKSYVGGDPVVDLTANTIIAKTKNNLQSIEAKGDKLHFLDIQVTVPSPSSFNIFKLNFSNYGNQLFSGEVGNSFIPSLNNASFSIEIGEGNIYFNPSAKSFLLGSTEVIDLMIDVNQDIVAVGTVINYDPDVLKIEIIDSPDFQVVGSEINDTDNGKYTLVRGTYGNGNPTDGNELNNGMGLNGQAKIVSLRVFSSMETAKTEMILENLMIVKDDGQGTQESITGGKGSYKITKQSPHKDKLSISDLNYVCKYVKSIDSNDLTFSWTTNLKAKSSVTIEDQSVDSNDFKTKHNLTIKNISGTGQYTIKSSSLDVQSEFATVVGNFDCSVDTADLKIKNLVVTPYTNGDADVFFMTIGGINDGKARGEIVSLTKVSNKETVSGTPIDTNVHRFNLGNLENDKEYTLRVKATDDDSSNEKEITFTTPIDISNKKGNIVLKVERDRICGSWLYCNSAVQVKNSRNKTENLCFDIGLCNRLDSNGNCLSSVNLGELGVVGGNQTFNSPSIVDVDKVLEQENKFKNLSGYSKVGMSWGGDVSFEGYKHYATMRQRGENISIPNNNFELGDSWPWENNAFGFVSVIEDIYQTGNHILQIATDEKNALGKTGVLYAGAKIPVYIPAGNDHVLSFDIRSSSESKEVFVQLDLEGTGQYTNINSNEPLNGDIPFLVGKGFQKITVPLGKNFTQGQNAELIFTQSHDWTKSFEEFKKSFYIDNVSLKPVLNVQNAVEDIDNLYVTRSCRLYPEVDAPDCDYTSMKDGKQYQGWKGYCVEPDPIDENMCLNWYPVDILTGESEVFGSDPISGYYDRSPLYFCLQSKGGYPYYDRTISGIGYKKVFDNPGHKTWSIPVDVQDIYKDEIIQVKITGVDIFYDRGNRCSSVTALTDKGGKDTSSLPRGGGETNNGALIFDYKNKEHWTDSLIGGKCSSGGKKSQMNPYVAIRCSGEGRENDCNVMSARLVFNSVDKLTGIEVRADEATGDGEARFGSILITTLGERCDVIAQVVDPFGKNYAFSQNTKKNAWINNNPLSYIYNQDYKPYGAVVPPANEEENIFPNQPETWQTPLYVMPPDTMVGLQKPYQVRAGSPYSVGGSGTGVTEKTCIVGKVGEACGDSIDCTLDSGTCALKADGSEGVSDDYICTNGSVLKSKKDHCYDDSDAREECIGGVHDGELCSPTDPTIPGMECYDTTQTGSCTGISSNKYCASNQRLKDFTICSRGHYSMIGEACSSNYDCDPENNLISSNDTGEYALCEIIDDCHILDPNLNDRIYGNGGANDRFTGDLSDAINGACMVDWGKCESGVAGPSDLRCEIPGICSSKGIIGKTQCVAGSSEKLGQECKSSYDCGYPEGLCVGINLTEDQQDQLVGGWEKGIENLSGLFVRALGVWWWNNEDKKYVNQCKYNDSISDSHCWDKRAEFGVFPKVFNITVNNQKTSLDLDKNKEILVFKGTASIVLRFNVDIDENQLPMTSYRVDWGDGKQSAISNLRIAPRLDPKNPHIMLHTYSCEDASECEFTPRIQVQDNWEMCNGGDKNTNDLCPISTGVWEFFNGKIIIE